MMTKTVYLEISANQCATETHRRMKTTLVIAIAALTVAAFARDLDSYGYVPPATLNPGLDQCFTAQGETKRCDQAKLETTRRGD
jgi:hypothetical protein